MCSRHVCYVKYNTLQTLSAGDLLWLLYVYPTRLALQITRLNAWVPLRPEQEPEACSRSLLALLLARVTNPAAAPITRSAAAAYLASFLARASFVPDAVLVDALQVPHLSRGSEGVIKRADSSSC